MRLYRLIGLEIMALQEEYAEILKKIDKYQDILEHPASMKKVMKKDLEKIKKSMDLKKNRTYQCKGCSCKSTAN